MKYRKKNISINLHKVIHNANAFTACTNNFSPLFHPSLLLRLHFIDFLWLLNIACCTVACCKFHECDSLKIYPIQIFSANALSWCAKCTTMKLNCRRPRPTTMSNHWREAILSMIVSHGFAWSAGRSSTWAICCIQFRWFTRLRSWMNVGTFEDTFELLYNRFWWVLGCEKVQGLFTNDILRQIKKGWSKIFENLKMLKVFENF